MTETISTGSSCLNNNGIVLCYNTVTAGNAFCYCNSYIANNSQNLFSYKNSRDLVNVPPYTDTLCCKCKGKQCFKYVITFQPTATSSIYRAYMHIEIEGAARERLGGVTVHYTRRIDGKDTYSEEETVWFKWNDDDNSPEKIPQYIGDIFMDKNASTGQYYYKKNNIKVIIRDIVCRSDKADNTVAKEGTFIDARDGRVYKWVRIGKDTWMAENLSYVTLTSHCYGDNTPKNDCVQYGRLYKWDDAIKACPAGWHLPSEEEIGSLLDNTGGSGKAAYKQLIADGNSGFNALPGGYGTRVNGGKGFHFVPPGTGDYYSAFWSSTVGNEGACTLYDLNNVTSSSRYCLGFDKNFSASKCTFCSISDWLYVRCVKDKSPGYQVKTTNNQQNNNTNGNQNSTQLNTNNGNNVNNSNINNQTNTNDNTVHNFYIIVGSYPTEKDAQDAVASLKVKGFPNAKVVGVSAMGSWRISCSDFATKAEAQAELTRIKPIISTGWVFEKK